MQRCSKNLLVAAIVAFPGVCLAAERQVSTGAQAHADVYWLPDGSALLSTASNGADFDIFETPIEGGAPSVLVGGAGHQVLHDVSNNGGVVFTDDLGLETPQLFVIPPGQSPQQLTNDGGLYSNASFSPNSSFLIYSRKQDNGAVETPIELWRLDLPGGPPVMLAGGDGIDRMEPVISPDGQTVAYTRIDGANRLQVWTIPVGGGSETQLTSNPATHLQPDWSPDGQSITATQCPDENSPTSLVRIDFPGGGKGSLVSNPGSAGSPDHSPTQPALAFTHEVPEIGVELRMLNLEAPPLPLPVTAGGINLSPTFSPDGTLLAYIKYAGSDPPQLWVSDLQVVGDIPAASAWGILMMTSTLLAFATIVLMRRRSSVDGHRC